jgi:FkbM family methyltransferase
MNLKNQVKQTLRHFGHAMVSSIHDRLNGVDAELRTLGTQAAELGAAQKNLAGRLQEIEGRMNTVSDQSADAGETQNALLESEICLVELLRRLQSDLQQLQTDLQQVQDGQRQHVQQLSRQSRTIAESQKELSTQILAAVGQEVNEISRQVNAVGQQVNTDSNKLEHQVLDLQHYTQNVFDQELIRQVCVETSDYGAVNPETELMDFLYSFLPTPKALDIGAHVGDVSARLLKTGYEVFAFEPYPPSYDELTRRLGQEPAFHAHNFAIGSVEGDLPLHLASDHSADQIYDDATVFNSLAPHSMPEDLPFVNTVAVPVKNLAGLHRAGTLPANVSLVKIDTEGYDLEVIRGMQEFRYPVVMVEYWDREIPFGKSGLLYTFESLVEEMKERGYRWHIVIYRIWGLNQRAFYCNHGRSVPNSWGNIVFFQNFDLFAQAQTWCSAVLPRTFFKPAPVKRATGPAGHSQIAD